MTYKQVYKKAAEHLYNKHDYEGCCTAIYNVLDSDSELEYKDKTNLFINLYQKEALEATGSYLYWFGPLNEETKQARILALLFCAEMCE